MLAEAPMTCALFPPMPAFSGRFQANPSYWLDCHIIRNNLCCLTQNRQVLVITTFVGEIWPRITTFVGEIWPRITTFVGGIFTTFVGDSYYICGKVLHCGNYYICGLYRDIRFLVQGRVSLIRFRVKVKIGVLLSCQFCLLQSWRFVQIDLIEWGNFSGGACVCVLVPIWCLFVQGARDKSILWIHHFPSFRWWQYAPTDGTVLGWTMPLLYCAKEELLIMDAVQSWDRALGLGFTLAFVSGVFVIMKLVFF